VGTHAEIAGGLFGVSTFPLCMKESTDIQQDPSAKNRSISLCRVYTIHKLQLVRQMDQRGLVKAPK